MGNGLTIIQRADILSGTWNSFCDRHPGAWWWWRDEWISYQVARGAQDLSFGIWKAGKLVAMCPLLLEERDGKRTFTMEGHPGPCPLIGTTERDKSLAFETASESHDQIEWRVHELVEEHCVTRCAMRASPFEPPGGVKLGSREGGDISWQTQIISLIPDRSNLWRGVRKSYRPLIHHAEGSYEIVVDDQGKSIDAFRQLHAEVTARETRPCLTWEMMQRWCETGNGLHVCAVLGGVIVACAYFEVYKGCAYFGHAASLHKNLNHSLIWRAMQELKARGVEQLEMGWLTYPGEESRAIFRTGFGGEARTIYAVERRF